MASEHHSSHNVLTHNTRNGYSLITMVVVATTLIMTWLWGPTRASWDAIDVLTFRTLNNTLQIGSVWQTGWALLNTRIFDVICGMVLLALIFTAYWERRAGVAGLVYLGLAVLALVIGRQIGTEMIITDYLGYERLSPSLSLEGSYRLSQLVPTVYCKDASPWSFPGDHGFVVLGFAIYLSFWARRRTSIAAWILAAVVILPRLVSGGHWLTDIFIGSLSMAILTMALLMPTGLHDWLVRRISSLFDGATSDATTRSNKVDESQSSHENEDDSANELPRSNAA